MMEKLFILGTGAQARYIIENNASNDNPFEIILVDLLSKDNVGKKINGCNIAFHVNDFIKEHKGNTSIKIIIAIGDKNEKMRAIATAHDCGFTFINSINSNAYLSKNIKLGKGIIINAGVTIMPNSTIGDHCIIHSGSVIEHDNNIGTNTNIGPGVKTAGYVNIGDNSIVYTGVNIAPKVSIGHDVIVGIGSTVLNDLSKKGVYYGTPAKFQYE